MDLENIILKHLKRVGAKGLCLDECGCKAPDLMPCGAPNPRCVPAVPQACGPDCPKCEGHGCMVPHKKSKGVKDERRRIRLR